MNYEEGLTPEQIKELQEWGDYSEKAQEAYAERQNEATLYGLDGTVHLLQKPSPPAWLAEHERTFRAREESEWQEIYQKEEFPF